MNETQAVARITAIAQTHMPVHTIVRVESKPLDPTRYVARYAVVFQEGSISQAMISDMLREYTDNGGKLEFAGTSRSLDNLNTDVMFVNATINAHQL